MKKLIIKEDKTMTFMEVFVSTALNLLQNLVSGISPISWILGIGYLIVDGAIITFVWLALRVRQFMKEEEES